MKLALLTTGSGLLLALNADAQYFGSIDIAPHVPAHSNRVADLDGDGDGDIAFTQSETGELHWMENLDGAGKAWRAEASRWRRRRRAAVRRRGIGARRALAESCS